MRTLWLAMIFGFTPPLMATAAPPLPTMIPIFVCETVKGHYVEDMAKQGTVVMGARGWVDLDWAYSYDLGIPLKVCERQYVAIQDVHGRGLAAEARAVPVTPDASNPMHCAWLAMQIGTNLAQVGADPGPGIIVGCPRALYDEQDNIIGYTDPPCPKTAICSNEPEDI